MNTKAVLTIACLPLLAFTGRAAAQCGEGPSMSAAHWEIHAPTCADAASIAAELDAAVSRWSIYFGAAPPRPLPVVLFRSLEELASFDWPAFRRGRFEPGERVLPWVEGGLPGVEGDRPLAHEACHVFLDLHAEAVLGRDTVAEWAYGVRQLPDWYDEGVALLCEPEAQQERRLKQLAEAWEARLPLTVLLSMEHPLAALMDPAAVARAAVPAAPDSATPSPIAVVELRSSDPLLRRAPVFYAQALSLLLFLAERDGPRSVGGLADRALRQARLGGAVKLLDDAPDALELAWEDWFRAAGASQAQPAPSADAEEAAVSRPPLLLHLPVLDLPYNFAHGGRAPSMAQSLVVTEAFYELAHRRISDLWGDRRTYAAISVGVFDYLTMAVPGATAWLHEEFHRAVMGNRGVDSFNDVYKLNLFAETIAVSRVRDDDLVRLKAEHPAEQVRLSAAGLEADYLLTQQLERNLFFGRSRAPHVPLLWLTKLGAALYVWSGHTSEAEELTIEMNERDGANVRARDFTGHDFTAWAYDLHRPDEPYHERGVHPSGVGIDRYIKPSDLTAEERAYLRRQGRLNFLNFLDPHLIGLHAFSVRSPFNGQVMRWNAAVGHTLTSFGHTLNLNLLLQQAAWDVHVVLHRYENGARAFPGIDATVFDYPLTVGGRELRVTPRASLWQQPASQDFRTRSASLGGLASLRVAVPAGSWWGAFTEIEAKTAGWVAGSVSLESQISLRAGGTFLLRM